ncbi:fumarylacetoacetate hydrolase family protein [Nonomuraea sp. NPDC049152]|uniref:2-keto-4-pentenoate hydratase n=1 Tax=Nonomuraea sp. NPDC049152 TaxID=3154350 RepID=UPI0034042760
MKLAQALHEAALTRMPIPQPVDELDVATAYEIQEEVVGLRGEPLSGVKLGFTSEGKRRQMGVNDLILGRLTPSMAVVDHDKYIHPRVEPEVAYLVGRRIESVEDATRPGAVAAVAAGIEVIDSRYENFRFSLESVIADNTSAAGYTIGPWRPYDVDDWNLGVVFEIDGRPVHVGSTAAILGDPRRAIVEAARLAVQVGLVIEEGAILLAGAATPAEPLLSGAHVQVEIQRLGRVAL